MPRRPAANLKYAAGTLRVMFPLNKLLRENEVNGFLRDCEGVEGFEFVERVLDYFKASYAIVDREIERIPSEGKVVLFIDRPLGLLEAAALTKLVRQVRPDVRIVANDGLIPFAGLRSLLIPHEAIRASLENDEALIVGGNLPVAPEAKAPLVRLRIGRLNLAQFYGLAAFFRLGATLPIRIGEPVPWKLPGTAKAKLLGFKSEIPIARPEDRVLLRRELQEAQLLGHTGDGKKIVLFDPKPDSAVLRELGRLREVAFRRVGEGTGKRRDIDTCDAYYRHVVLWDDSELQIAGAYRIGDTARILEALGPEGLYTHRLFAYGEGLQRYLPQSLELGRSFVQPRYQGLRALDYLWQGIGAYLATRSDVRYLFGPVSLSASYPDAARWMIVYFFSTHLGERETLVAPRNPFVIPSTREDELRRLMPGQDFAADLRTLKRELAGMGLSIPVLYKQYSELCEPGGTRFLGFNVDPAFSSCVDGFVMLDLEKLKAHKRSRYLGGFAQQQPAQAPAAFLKSA
jgi:putative hemolysin